ncbi:META domain-containing protein [Synechococcales cyanobacterium C]|uniref:META domain-containing protein n=1 Tax=Petrachloros mirabilis ULC683 TaxID=2781853 RepID=A0A8K1ZVZ6_9CYAN|nr:META domain-containing protein [Petrachloros mirabilis]NCJ05127.1 META domain-containing protein [Petrachloros mirabilis ULC683]
MKLSVYWFILGLVAAALGGLESLKQPAIAESEAPRYNCLTREVFTPAKRAWCDRWYTQQAQPESTDVVSSPNETIATLEHTLWSLTHYRTPAGNTVPAQTFVTPASIQFREGRVGGNATCNRFFGDYTLDGETLSIQSGGATLMACPEELMAQEQGFFAALEQVRGTAIANGELRLLDGEGAVLLTFAQSIPPALTGTLWHLTAYNNGQDAVTSLIAGTHITATFDANGGLTGFAGCNTYMAAYEVTDTALNISTSASTRKFCNQPEGVMTQESAYLQALTTATQFEIENNTLILKSEEGATVARFTTSPESRSFSG